MHTVALRDILRLTSSESEWLLCRRGHVAGHPHSCPGGCLHLAGGSVADALPFKAAHRVAEWTARLAHVDTWPPLQIENGYLLDGHHRVAAACRTDLDTLTVVHVTGVLTEQQNYHQTLHRRLFRQPHRTPPQGRTATPTPPID